jgi:hypothetical protein
MLSSSGTKLTAEVFQRFWKFGLLSPNIYHPKLLTSHGVSIETGLSDKVVEVVIPFSEPSSARLCNERNAPPSVVLKNFPVAFVPSSDFIAFFRFNHSIPNVNTNATQAAAKAYMKTSRRALAYIPRRVWSISASEAKVCKLAAPAEITAEGFSDGNWLETLLKRPFTKMLWLMDAARALDREFRIRITSHFPLLEKLTLPTARRRQKWLDEVLACKIKKIKKHLPFPVGISSSLQISQLWHSVKENSNTWEQLAAPYMVHSFRSPFRSHWLRGMQPKFL